MIGYVEEVVVSYNKLFNGVLLEGDIVVEYWSMVVKILVCCGEVINQLKCINVDVLGNMGL